MWFNNFKKLILSISEKQAKYRTQAGMKLHYKIIGKISTQKCISGTSGLNEMTCLIPNTRTFKFGFETELNRPSRFGQCKCKDRTDTDLAFHPYAAAMQFDDSFDDGKTQTGTFLTCGRANAGFAKFRE
jgi:hypothetical protein